MYSNRHITVIIPALNEAPSISRVIDGLFGLFVCSQCTQNESDNAPGTVVEYRADLLDADTGSKDKVSCAAPAEPAVRCSTCSGSLSRVVDQIVVCDNGSTDDTASIAFASGAIVVKEPGRGYGSACLAALAAPVDKDFIVFVDADHSVVATELPTLLQPLLNGADLVIGSRTLGHCEKGALSVPQAFGNRLASALMRLLWRGQVTDLGPFRAVTNTALTAMHMSDKKFGWTVEMQIRAFQLSLTTAEVPVSTRRRIGKSKISGTVRGVLGAAHGILGTIGKLYWRQITGAYPSALRHEQGAQRREKSELSAPLSVQPLGDTPRETQ